ncbi:immunoglobulin kappa light chain-like [Centroberyx affinis]|uniref:immunoglobulin kappa light chain-like n=1 Tax=Centroberyx affinis TaxID=166261 RepID=UPI003A5C3545
MKMFLVFALAAVLFSEGSRGQHTVTQTPTETTVSAGQTVSLGCKASANVDGDCGQSSNLQCQVWYRQKPGETPRAVTRVGNSLAAGTPSRFNAAGSGRDFTLTISGVQAEDAGVYYCCTEHYLSAVSLWYTFGGGTKLVVKTGVSVPPSLSLLPPSREQLSGGEATLLCLLSGYSPQGAQVSWAVDGREVTAGVLTGEEAERDGGKSVRSSTLTLSKALWEGGDLYSCKATHDGSVRTATLRRTECSV